MFLSNGFLVAPKRGHFCNLAVIDAFPLLMMHESAHVLKMQICFYQTNTYTHYLSIPSIYSSLCRPLSSSLSLSIQVF